jgi:hypothetical protein
MTSTCAQCREPLASAAGFCGKCGARQPEPAEDEAAVARYRAVMQRLAGDGNLDQNERAQLLTLRQRLGVSQTTHERLLAELATPASKLAAWLRLYVDVVTIRHFQVAARCLLRFRAENLSDLALERLELRCELAGEEPLVAAGSSLLLPGASQVLSLWLIPKVAGHQELTGVLAAVDVLGSRGRYRIGKIQFRVASASDAARVQVVNIDQRNARVVDNSRSNFAGDPRATGAGLIAEGESEWQPVLLEPLPLEDGPRAPPAPGQQLEHAGRKYPMTRLIGRSDRFTLHECALADGRPGIVKIAASASENPALDREAFILGLMAEQAARIDEENRDGQPFNYQSFFPALVDSFVDAAQGRARINVLAFPEAISGLGQLQPLAQLSEGGRTRADPRSAAWILGKALKVLAFAHQLGISNGRVEAENLMVETEQHGVLLFDWTRAVAHPDGTVPGPLARREIAQLAAMTATLLGADPRTGVLPASDQLTDGRFEELIRRMAAGGWADAGAAHHAFYDLIGQIWPRKFHPFTTYRREG